VTATSVERVNGTPLPAEPRLEYDPVAHAEAEAIRTRAEADAEARRIAAEAEAKAKLATAEEEARKLRLANDKLEGRAKEERAAREARIAKHNLERAAAERAQREGAEQAEAAKAEQEKATEEVAEADDRWRSYALNFYRVCAVVALPVQVSAFYNPKAIWLMAAPLMLEGGAWVVLKGAAAAVANRRPSWHYRLIAWLLAFIAAGINLWHGLNAFDPATALATAFASIAGPGVWDLHEHGRIRKRDGIPTRRERKAAEKAERAEAARRADEEKRRAAEKEAAAKAAEEARARLNEDRQREFEDVWAEAVKIGAALGKAPDDPAVWPRAYRNIKGCDPGESIESITARRAAEKRVQAALASAPVSTLSKTTNAQRASQVPGAKKPRVYTPPKNRGKRTKGDVKYTPAARNQASIAAKQATEKKDSQ
jgi:chemotaxis protein histidine kinase CheA